MILPEQQHKLGRGVTEDWKVVAAAIDVQQGYLQTIRVSRCANSWFSDATTLHLVDASSGHLHPCIRSDSSDSSAN